MSVSLRRIPMHSITHRHAFHQADDQKVKDYGVSLAIDLCNRLTREGDIKGVHFTTLNLEKSVRRVLEGLGWSHVPPASPNKIIIVRVPSLFPHISYAHTNLTSMSNNQGHPGEPRRLTSSTRLAHLRLRRQPSRRTAHHARRPRERAATYLRLDERCGMGRFPERPVW